MSSMGEPVRIFSQNENNLVSDLNGSDISPGKRIIACSSNGVFNQHRKQRDVGDGYFEIVFQASELEI